MALSCVLFKKKERWKCQHLNFKGWIQKWHTSLLPHATTLVRTYYMFTLSCKEQWANIIFSLVTIWPANYYGRQEGKEFGEMTTILAIALEVKSKFMTTVQSFVLENKSYLFLYDWYVYICYFMSSKITISYITTIPERDLIKVLEPSTSAKISTPHWQVGTLLC